MKKTEMSQRLQLSTELKVQVEKGAWHTLCSKKYYGQHAAIPEIMDEIIAIFSRTDEKTSTKSSPFLVLRCQFKKGRKQQNKWDSGLGTAFQTQVSQGQRGHCQVHTVLSIWRGANLPVGWCRACYTLTDWTVCFVARYDDVAYLTLPLKDDRPFW